MMHLQRRHKKLVSLLLTGSLLTGIGGCLGLDLDRIIRFGAFVAATEFVLDNDTVFDLFPDSTN